MAASSSHRSGPAPVPEHGQPSSSDGVLEDEGYQHDGFATGTDISADCRRLIAAIALASAADIDADLLEVPQAQPRMSAISIEGRVAALRAVALRDSPVDAWMLRFLYAQRTEELHLFNK